MIYGRLLEALPKGFTGTAPPDAGGRVYYYVKGKRVSKATFNEMTGGKSGSAEKPPEVPEKKLTLSGAKAEYLKNKFGPEYFEDAKKWAETFPKEEAEKPSPERMDQIREGVEAALQKHYDEYKADMPLDAAFKEVKKSIPDLTPKQFRETLMRHRKEQLAGKPTNFSLSEWTGSVDRMSPDLAQIAVDNRGDAYHDVGALHKMGADGEERTINGYLRVGGPNRTGSTRPSSTPAATAPTPEALKSKYAGKLALDLWTEARKRGLKASMDSSPEELEKLLTKDDQKPTGGTPMPRETFLSRIGRLFSKLRG